MMTFNIGITATRDGLTGPQLRTIIEKILGLRATSTEGVALHQGCCDGGDEQITIVAASLGIPIVAYPPTDKKLFSTLAYELSRTVMPEGPYLERNGRIVNACDMLIGAPKQKYEELRSGTWSTIRYARSLNKMMTIVWRDGGASDYA